jgi:hypothetical protein
MSSKSASTSEYPSGYLHCSPQAVIRYLGSESRTLTEASMGWLLRRGEVLASLDVKDRVASPANGRIEVGALLCHDTRLITGFGARPAIDVAWLDAELIVRHVGHVGRFGVRLGPRDCQAVLSAERGAFERWKLAVGDQLEVRE